MSEWISVKDRLPEPHVFRAYPIYVLVVDATNRMAVAYRGNRWVSAKAIGEVTHWMPLPDPPMKDAAPTERTA